MAYTLWALTHGPVSLELSHASRTPLAHPALAETDGQDVLDTALRATLAGWTDRAQPPMTLSRRLTVGRFRLSGSHAAQIFP